ncbi:MAG: hypothetical protein Q8N15_06675 [Bacillota bacterium]|nr:hypothetical protein [Bacillota bacterium]
MPVQYAISWDITLETPSGLMMTLSILCDFVTSIYYRRSPSSRF